jgi:hypothetical protein
MKPHNLMVVLILTIGLSLINLSMGLGTYSTPSTLHGMDLVRNDNTAFNVAAPVSSSHFSDTAGYAANTFLVNDASLSIENPGAFSYVHYLLDETQQSQLPTDTPSPTSIPPTDTPAPQYEYTLTVVSAHGSVSKSPNQATYHYGDVVNISVSPVPGWAFAYWSGDLTGSSNPGVVSIYGSMVVVANYIQDDYTVTVDASHGTVVIDPNQATYHEGDVVKLTAIPSSGWVFDYWTGGLTGSTNPSSITVHGSISITAKFSKISSTSSVPTQTPVSIISNKPSPTIIGATQLSTATPTIVITSTPTVAVFVQPSSTPVVPKFLPETPKDTSSLQLGAVITLSIVSLIIVVWSVRFKKWGPRN